MKKIFNVVYILDVVIIYLVMLVFLLWSIFHTTNRFPPKIIAVVIFLSVVIAFISLMKIFYKKANMYHLVSSIVLPALLLLSPLYYMIPIMAEAMPIIERKMLMTSEVPELNFILSTMKSTLENHDFFSLEHVSRLFLDKTLPLLIFTLISIAVYSFGNYTKYMSHKLEIKKQTSGNLL